MFAIETTNLTKKFKDKIVVDNLNLQIKQGELFSLLGTNGAGKTTTIKMLTTLLSSTDGQILINGLNIKNDAQKIKNIINATQM